MSNNKFTVADYLLTRLKQLGLDKIFQVPGDYVQEFMQALDDFDGIDAVGDVNELGAGYAADGYARLKGIGAISVQYGVGTLSALNAVAGSYVERNPVVVITASPSTENRVTIEQTGVLFHHSTGNLNCDRNVYKNVTVAAEIMADACEAPKQIDAALTAAITHSRPIYLEAYQNIWGAQCSKPMYQLAPIHTPSQKESLAAMVTAAINKISSAKQPVLLLGIEIARFGLQQNTIDLLAASGLPFTTTTLAKTVLSEEHKQFIGTYADGASIKATSTYMEKSDCILTLGAILTDDYLNMLEKQFDSMIVVDADSARIGYQHYKNIQLTEFIIALTAAFKAGCEYPRENIELGLLQPQPKISDALKEADLNYQNFFDLFYAYLLNNDLKNSTNLILGESSSLYQAIRLHGLPQNSFISDAAWGSLGHETGCVTGVSYASPKRSMVIAGDGGFMMMCQALSTISRNKLNPVVFVMSNGVYAIEQSFVNICAFTPHGEFAPFDVLPSWDYLSLAKAYGMLGHKVKTGEDLLKTLDHIKQNPHEPILVEVVIDKHALAPAMAGLVESITHKTVDQCQAKDH